MKKIAEKLKNKFHYTIESIRNRYPCKLIKIKNFDDPNKKTLVTYQAVGRFNVRESTLENILNDPMIIEKFHPTDAVKIGFLSAGEILLKGNRNREEIQRDCELIISNMFNDSVFSQ